MDFRGAALSAFRHFAISLAALLAGLPTASAVLDIQAIGEPILVAVYVALLAGIIRFLQRIAEEGVKEGVQDTKKT